MRFSGLVKGFKILIHLITVLFGCYFLNYFLISFFQLGRYSGTFFRLLYRQIS